MRKHNLQSNAITYQDSAHTIIVGAENHHFENTSAIINDNTHKSPGHLTLSNSATFTSCVWRNCEAQTGGGIYLTAGSTVTLTVKKSEFDSCKANPNRGGAIYAEGIKTVTIEYSLFHQCMAVARNDYGGGAIEICNIQNPPSIEATSFILCKSGNDAGGVGIWDSPSFQKICLTDSRFVECKGLASAGSDGGCLIVWFSNAAIGCSNTLFIDSRSEQRGGGASYYIYSSADHQSSIHLFFFCFFKNNSAILTPGNDVFFYDWISENPFLHCFSSTRNNRVYYNGNVDDWLPLGTSLHLNEQEGMPFCSFSPVDLGEDQCPLLLLFV